jgi:polar amino acid transport system substrate-binding protein
MAEELGLEYSFEIAQQFGEMLAKVERREADAAIANITITSAREQTMDFTQPIFDAGIQVMVRDADGQVDLFGALFNWEMLGLVVLAGVILFVIANLMWFFERRDQPYFQYPYKEGIWRSFWWALNVIVNGGFEERVPQTRRGRVFAVFLVIASLFLVSAFVAKITAALTVSELKSQIQSYRDLFNRRVGTTAGSTSAAFLDFHSVPYRSFNGLEDVFEALEARELDAASRCRREVHFARGSTACCSKCARMAGMKNSTGAGSAAVPDDWSRWAGRGGDGARWPDQTRNIAIQISRSAISTIRTAETRRKPS